MGCDADLRGGAGGIRGAVERRPEETELVVDWLLPPATLGSHADQVERMLALGRLLVEQDGRACELNQQGIKSRRDEHGVLVPQEDGVWEFHEWLRRRLDD